jgi:hypothetical protein
VALLLGTPACAGPVIGAGGKPVHRATPSNAEMCGADASPAIPDSYVTVLLRLQELSPEGRARLLKGLDEGRGPGEVCDCAVLAPVDDTIIVTERRSKLERLLRRAIGR